MLLAGHVGYTVGAAWAFEAATHRQTPLDYRAVTVMAVAPDIIDRALFVLSMPSAIDARLIAHTLLFQLGFLLAIVVLRRRWWLYGTASVCHLMLDSTGISYRWLRQVLWPFLGTRWDYVNIVPGTGEITEPYQNWVWLRLQEAAQPYLDATWWVWLLELGGALVLLAFAYRKALYQPLRLRRLLTVGKI